MQLHGRHVNLVEIRPLLAVDLDADEMLVQESADVFILEALVLHDVAPVARRVADAQEDRPVELPGAARALPGPRDTSPRGCGRAAAGTGWSRLQDDWCAS